MANRENILKRTAFEIVYRDGSKERTHWASVVTTIGQMVEPFTPGMMGMSTASIYDPQEDCARIDEMVQIANGREAMVLSPDAELSGGVALHGGSTWLRA